MTDRHTHAQTDLRALTERQTHSGTNRPTRTDRETDSHIPSLGAVVLRSCRWDADHCGAVRTLL